MVPTLGTLSLVQVTVLYYDWSLLLRIKVYVIIISHTFCPTLVLLLFPVPVFPSDMRTKLSPSNRTLS